MSISPEPGQAPRADDLVDALVQAAFVITAELSKIAAESDLSLTQLRVLGILQDRRLRMSALADYLGLEKSTMSGLVDRAEKRGLLERAPSAGDGRSVEVFLSAKGLRHAAVVRERVRDALSPLIGELGTLEQQRLHRLLDRMRGGREP